MTPNVGYYPWSVKSCVTHCFADAHDWHRGAYPSWWEAEPNCCQWPSGAKPTGPPAAGRAAVVSHYQALPCAWARLPLESLRVGPVAGTSTLRNAQQAHDSLVHCRSGARLLEELLRADGGGEGWRREQWEYVVNERLFRRRLSPEAMRQVEACLNLRSMTGSLHFGAACTCCLYETGRGFERWAPLPCAIHEHMNRTAGHMLLLLTALGCGSDKGQSIPHAVASESDSACASCHHPHEPGCVSCHSVRKAWLPLAEVPTSAPDAEAPATPHQAPETKDSACMRCHQSAKWDAPKSPHSNTEIGCVSCHGPS